MHAAMCVAKLSCRFLEPVSENTEAMLNSGTGMSYGFNAFESAPPSRYEIVDDHYILFRMQDPLDLVLQPVFLRERPNINERCP